MASGDTEIRCPYNDCRSFVNEVEIRQVCMYMQVLATFRAKLYHNMATIIVLYRMNTT